MKKFGPITTAVAVRHSLPNAPGTWGRDGHDYVVTVEWLNRGSFVVVFPLGNEWEVKSLPSFKVGGWFPLPEKTKQPAGG